MNKSIKLQNDTYLDSSSITHNKKSLNDILNGLIKVDTIVGLSLKENDSYQLTLPAQTLFVEVLLDSFGSTYSGGNFIGVNNTFSYLTNTNVKSGENNGVFVKINYNGLVNISAYKHCGADVTGFRIWYLNI